MTSMMTTAGPRALPEAAEQHRAHRLRLLDAREFRVDQLAALREETTRPRQGGVTSALRIAASAALREIDEALDRLAAGTYGACTGCGGTISADRLDALPMAPLCTSCHFNEQNCRISRRLAPPA